MCGSGGGSCTEDARVEDVCEMCVFCNAACCVFSVFAGPGVDASRGGGTVLCFVVGVCACVDGM